MGQVDLTVALGIFVEFGIGIALLVVAEEVARHHSLAIATQLQSGRFLLRMYDSRYCGAEGE